MADVGRISASKITTYKGCSMAYFLQYIAHEQVPEDGRLIFGKAIHWMLERFYDVDYKSPESFAKFWKYYWFRQVSGEGLKGKQRANLHQQEFRLKGDFVVKVGNHVTLGQDPVGALFGYMRLGENILKRFYLRHKLKPHPHATEYSFGGKKSEILEIAGVPIRVIFDRVDQMNGDWYITDYKTDKRSPKEDAFTLHRHPQFTLYSWAFRKLFNADEKAILYYHLRSGEVLKTHRSEDDYSYLQRLVEEVATGIEKDVFVPFYGFHCNMCRYKAVCEKYCIQYHGGPRIDDRGKIKSAETFDEWNQDIPNWMEDQAEER